MTPIEAVRREVEIELAALERRLGAKAVPDEVIIRVTLDRKTGMPRTVECHEQRERRILGGAIASVNHS